MQPQYDDAAAKQAEGNNVEAVEVITQYNTQIEQALVAQNVDVEGQLAAIAAQQQAAEGGEMMGMEGQMPPDQMAGMDQQQLPPDQMAAQQQLPPDQMAADAAAAQQMPPDQMAAQQQAAAPDQAAAQTAPCPFCQNPLAVGQTPCPACGNAIAWG
jgi:hypothetical protein